MRDIRQDAPLQCTTGHLAYTLPSRLTLKAREGFSNCNCHSIHWILMCLTGIRRLFSGHS